MHSESMESGMGIAPVTCCQFVPNSKYWFSFQVALSNPGRACEILIFSSSFLRNSPVISGLATSTGLSNGQISLHLPGEKLCTTHVGRWPVLLGRACILEIALALS